MEHIGGTAREQIVLIPYAIEDCISEGDPVRFFDAFVDGLDIVKLGFVRRKSNVPTPDFYHSKFQYDKERDLYICPQNRELRFLCKTWRERHWVSIYTTTDRRECKVRSRCTINKQGRRIYRSEDEEVLQRMRERISEHPDKIKVHKCLSEHPFGTIKHIWNQGYLLLRGLENVRVEVNLSILAYNMKRAMTIPGVPSLLQHFSAA